MLLHILNPTSFLPLLIYLTIIHQNVDACKRSVEYSACANTASLAQASCNDMVIDTPTLEYYGCLCRTSTDAMQCYAICPEDKQLQLHKQNQELRVSASCQGVAALVAQGYTTSDIFTSSPASPTSSLPTISPSNTPSFSATFYTPPPSVSSLNSVSADGASTVMMASSQDIAIAGDTRDAGGSTATLKNPKVTFGGDGASVGTRTQFDTLHIALYGVFLALFA